MADERHDVRPREGELKLDPELSATLDDHLRDLNRRRTYEAKSTEREPGVWWAEVTSEGLPMYEGGPFESESEALARANARMSIFTRVQREQLQEESVPPAPPEEPEPEPEAER